MFKVYVVVFFFFSSRRRHTRCLSDWSSDVCSSDLRHGGGAVSARASIAHINVSPEGGVPKRSVPSATVTELGLAGDTQRDRRYHGGPERAICLFALEQIQALQGEGHTITPGAIGENVTVVGLDWARIVPGSRLELGDQVVVEVTRYTSPCSNIKPGVTGCSLAFQLAGLGLRRVLVLERRFVGAGGTGRSVGIIRQLYPTPETTQMVTRSLRVFERFHEAVAGESGFVRSGALIGVSAAMRPALEKTLALQRGLGVQAEILEPAELARVEPSIDASSLGAILYEPGSGYGDPTAVTAGYAEAARKRGAIVEQGQEVTAIHQSGGRVTGITTAAGDRIDTPVVVNAAGLWSPAVARLAGVELPIVIGRHPVFVIERGPDFGRPHMVYLDLAGGSYVRPETGGFTLTGSLTDDETQHPMDPELLGAEPGFDEADVALERTSRALPGLAEARYARGWAGAFDITPDWMPILDESPLPGFFVAAGMSGHGFKLAPAVGEVMAALVTGVAPPVDRAPFRLARFAGRAGAGTFVSSYLGSE